MSAKIVTVFNQKGGCAKTMTSMQLAGTFGLRGLKVFVVDMDPQNTAALWFHQSTPEQPFPADVMSMAPLKEAFLDKLGPFVAKCDVIIIDCPPALGSRVPWAALVASDLALIPVVPVMDNVWASKQAEELVLEARQARESKGHHLRAQGRVSAQYRSPGERIRTLLGDFEIRRTNSNPEIDGGDAQRLPRIPTIWVCRQVIW